MIMKKLLPLILLLFINNAKAQSGSNWEWASNSGIATNSPGQQVLDVATDVTGNVYTTGRFTGSLTIAGVTVTAAYLQDAFIAKYDVAGNLIWLKQYNSSYNELGQIITLDATGNIYVGGTNSASTTGSSFILKYDGSGNLLWSKTLSLFEVGGINIGPDGNPIVMESNQYNKYIYKLNKLDGIQIWQVQNNGVGSNAGVTYKDFLDVSGNVYYTCFIPGAGTVTVAGQAITATGVYTNSFVASVDNNGVFRWVQTFTEVQIAIAYAVDKNGKSYIGKAGGAGGTFQGISTSTYKYYELNSVGVLIDYLAQYPFATKIRVKDDGIYSYAMLNGTTTAYSQYYGSYYYFIPPVSTYAVAVVIKYNLTNRNVIWANSFEMTGVAYIVGDINALDISSTGKVIVGGRYGTTAKFGSIIKSCTGGTTYPYDLYVAQFDGNNIPPQTIPITTWTGAANNMNFNDAANWDNGIPTGYSNAVLPAGISNYPNNFSASTYMRKLTINTGVTVTLPLALKTSLGIVNNGTIEINETGTFYGAFDNGGTTVVSGTGKIVIKNIGVGYFGYGNGSILDNSLEFNAAGTFGFLGGTITGNLILTNGVVRASNPLVMSNPNATITNTTSSFISGTITRKVNASGTYSFPLTSYPSASSYNPVSITLNNIVGPQYISANFTSNLNGTAPNTTAGGQTVTTLLNGGFWTVTPDAPLTSGNYTINLEQRGFSNSVATASRYVVLKRPNSSGSWGFYGSNGVATYSSTVITARAGNITGFSDFAIGIASSPVNVTLPITLISFVAEKNNSSVLLNWKTAQEINNHHFEIQHSLNSIDWFQIGTTLSANKSDGSSYNFTHTQPSIGKNYYRIKQIDIDGKYTFSNILVMVYNNYENIQVYPTFTNQSFTIQNNEADNLVLQILSADGKIIMHRNLNKGTNIISLDNKAAGNYVYQIGSKVMVLKSGKIVKY